MSSCSSCNSAAQAYQSVSQQTNLKQQFANLQKQATDPFDAPASGQQALNSSGRGQLVNIST